jgi:dTDP-glucose 4,6-dehydratase
MKVLVTGGAGFIGLNFALMYQDGEFPSFNELDILDRFSTGSHPESYLRKKLDAKIKIINSNLCDLNSYLNIISSYDLIIHFAAESHVDRSIESPAQFTNDNILSTLNILEAIRQNPETRIVIISTDEVYGSSNGNFFDENSNLKPSSPYAASKAAGDLIARSYMHTFGLNVLITRCTNNFGPYQHLEKFLPKCIVNSLTNQDIPIYGSGNQQRNWIYVKDHCTAIYLLAISEEKGIFNISGLTEYENINLARKVIQEIKHTKAAISYVPDRKAHDIRYQISDSKFRELFPNFELTPFNYALKETIDWYSGMLSNVNE